LNRIGGCEPAAVAVDLSRGLGDGADDDGLLAGWWWLRCPLPAEKGRSITAAEGFVASSRRKNAAFSFAILSAARRRVLACDAAWRALRSPYASLREKPLSLNRPPPPPPIREDVTVCGENDAGEAPPRDADLGAPPRPSPPAVPVSRLAAGEPKAEPVRDDDGTRTAAPVVRVRATRRAGEGDAAS
jgi:hypothetical protein